MIFENLIGIQEIFAGFPFSTVGSEYDPGQIPFLKYRSDSGDVSRSSW